MTMHLIKIHVFTHASRVTSYELCTYSRCQSLWGLYNPSVVLQSHFDYWLKQSRKILAILTVFEYSAVKWNWCRGQADS